MRREHLFICVKYNESKDECKSCGSGLPHKGHSSCDGAYCGDLGSTEVVHCVPVTQIARWFPCINTCCTTYSKTT